MMGLMNSNSYGMGLALLFFLGAIGLGLVAAGYFVYIKKGTSKRTTKVGRFLNFDNYALETILKVLYLASAMSVAVFSLAIVFIGSMAGAQGFLVGALVAVPAFLLGQLMCRVIFEAFIMGVGMAVDIRKLRKNFVNNSAEIDVENTPLVASYVSAPSAMSAMRSVAEKKDESWICSQCGTLVSRGSFCVKCGARKK